MKTKTARLVKNVIQAVAVVTLGYVVRDKVAETGAWPWVAAGWLLTAWVVVRLALALKRGYGTFRTHTKAGVSVDSLDKLTTASMQPWMRGHYLMEKQAYRGTWRTVTRKPLAPAGDFSVAGGPNSAKAAAGLLLLVAVCAALAAWFLPTLVAASARRWLWLAGVTYLVVYSAIWIIGGRRRLKEGGHRLTDNELMLDIGLRGSGVVPLAAIASCSVQAGRTGQARSEVWTVAPGERTNVLIELKDETPLAITAFGSPRDISKRRIALYVDEPVAFARALSRAIAVRRDTAAA
jgi:hypothetical protein